MDKIELHIFTNCTDNIKECQTITETYNSFVDAFGKITPTIWLDPNPNRKDSDWYKTFLNKSFPDSQINLTTCLSDGYIRMIDNTKSNFIFALEHDWKFFKYNIYHTLDELCHIIKNNNISHLRLQRLHSSYTFDGIDIIGNPLIKTVAMAFNNPHILNVDEYRRTARKYIKVTALSYGIEENLINKDDCIFAVYGDSPVVEHLNGRDSSTWKKERQVIDVYLKILNRYPDQSGFNHYVTSNYTIQEIENILLNSEEYKNDRL